VKKVGRVFLDLIAGKDLLGAGITEAADAHIAERQQEKWADGCTVQPGVV